jgi:phosphomannomutase
LRASNTEPILRVAVESQSEARAEELFAGAMALLRG